jgi:Arc/MetJ-type ribon-helix-helix transcriptional regulator
MAHEEPDEFESFIQGHLRSGRFSSREQVLAWLDGEIQKGIDDLRAGRSMPLTDELIEDIKRRGRERLAAARRKAS